MDSKILQNPICASIRKSRRNNAPVRLSRRFSRSCRATGASLSPGRVESGAVRLQKLQQDRGLGLQKTKNMRRPEAFSNGVLSVFQRTQIGFARLQ